MRCVLSNSCTDRALCCNFCENKRCKDRCKDEHEKCKYFEIEPPKTEVEQPQEKKPWWSFLKPSKKKGEQA